LNSGRWLPRDPLLSAAIRSAAAWFVVGCAVLTVMGGMLTAHHARAGWLDRSIDSRIQAALAGHNRLLLAVANIAEPSRVALLIAALVVPCVAVKRLDGALLAAVSIPAAIAVSEGLKQLFDRTLNGAPVYPSGHTTTVFALAAVVMMLVLRPSRHVLPFALRLAITLAVMLTACAVALAMIGLNWHYFTDTLAGAAVAVGMVVGVSLAIDWAFRRATAAGSTTAPAKAADPAGPAGPDRGQPGPGDNWVIDGPSG
jgi:membrane-associated phospholipid phosphatase